MKTAYRMCVAALVACMVGCVSMRPNTWVINGELPPENLEVAIRAETTGMAISRMGEKDLCFVRFVWRDQAPNGPQGQFELATEKGCHDGPNGLIAQLFGANGPALYGSAVSTNGFIKLRANQVDFSKVPFGTNGGVDPHSSF